MKIIRYPKRSDRPELLARPESDTKEVRELVGEILGDVRRNGDEALRRYSTKFDRVVPERFRVAESELEAAAEKVPGELQEAIRTARENIERFHAAQAETPRRIETTPGVFCWRRSVPIERVGLYVPGGTAPLFSTVLMLAVPARIAGCREIVVCTPPGPDGRIDDVILWTARLCGVTGVFAVGGAQAVGALAYGTASVPRVDKIFGPGNRFVTAAKQLVAREGTAVDLPAGPSEVAVLADETSVPEFVAADLLAQAEHGPDSQVLLVSTNERVIARTLAALERQLRTLPRREIAAQALESSKAILVRDDEEALELLNEYAAEHLILAVGDAAEAAARVTCAGSVFIGNYSCESAGDYASGTNHTLPTNGHARAYSGVSLDSFVKKITYQELTAEGIRNLGPSIELMAAAEGLEAHRNAVAVRLKSLAAGDRTAAGRRVSREV